MGQKLRRVSTNSLANKIRSRNGKTMGDRKKSINPTREIFLSSPIAKARKPMMYVPSRIQNTTMPSALIIWCLYGKDTLIWDLHICSCQAEAERRSPLALGSPHDC